MIELLDDIPEDLRLLDREQVRATAYAMARTFIKDYDDFTHKGIRGHAALFAGSHGMMGAAILSAKACMKSGVGKTTVFVPETGFDLIHLSVPEALVKSNAKNNMDLSPYKAFGMGPGAGTDKTMEAWIERVFSMKKPVVLDADALNHIASHPQIIENIPRGSILTPHLLEWERLWGKAKNDKERIELTISIASKYKLLILIKGHFSCLILPEGRIHVNGTGNSGMGKAGSGDVLTGLLTGLLAQDYTPEQAGVLGMYLHGLAGDLAKGTVGEDAMTASDLIDHLHMAFRTLRN